MLYIVCVAYMSGAFLFAQRCAYRYRCLLLSGYLPDRRALMSAIVQALNRARTPQYYISRALGFYQRCLLLVGLAAAIVALSLYLYLYAVASVQNQYYLSLCWQLWVLTIVILLAYIDLKTRLLPDALCVPLLFSALLLGWLFPEQIALNSWLVVLMIAVVAYGVYALSNYFVGTPVLGLGDVKLYVALTACLPTLEAAVQAYFFACVGCWLLQALWQRHCLPLGSCAFGPYLGLGYLLANLSLPALQ